MILASYLPCRILQVILPFLNGCGESLHCVPDPYVPLSLQEGMAFAVSHISWISFSPLFPCSALLPTASINDKIEVVVDKILTGKHHRTPCLIRIRLLQKEKR